MFVIQTGCAEVVREEGGSEVVIGELAAGDVFGEMAIFDKQPRSATVRSKGSTRVLTLDKRAFLKRVHQDPSLAYQIMKRMSLTIRKLDRELEDLKRNHPGI
jgi:CRP-like cAMP-binding protein